MPTLKITNLHNWERNPKEITTDNFERLKVYLEKYGQIKPLIVNTGDEWGERGLVLGGNQRLRAYRELGIEDVEISWVTPENEEQAIELAFIDNEQFGRYVAENVAELLMPYRGTDLDNLRIALGSDARVGAILNTYAPSDGGVGLPAPDEPRGEDAPPDLNVEDYNQAYIKQIVMYFVSKDYEDVVKRIDEIKENEEPDSPLFDYYETVVEKVERIMERTELENTTDVFLFLLDFYERNSSN